MAKTASATSHLSLDGPRKLPRNKILPHVLLATLPTPMSVMTIIQLILVRALAMLTQQAAHTCIALACGTGTAVVADATRTVIILIAPLPS